MLIAGIDPGLSGAMTLITEESNIYAVYPFKHYTYHDISEAIKKLYYMGGPVPAIQKAYIEKVHSMPAQGVSSSFKFGLNFGIIQGLLIGLEIPLEFVTPQKWMKAMQCMTGGDKNVTKIRAQQLFPKWKITHGNADSILIAEYGRRIEIAGCHLAERGKP